MASRRQPIGFLLREPYFSASWWMQNPILQNPMTFVRQIIRQNLFWHDLAPPDFVSLHQAYFYSMPTAWMLRQYYSAGFIKSIPLLYP